MAIVFLFLMVAIFAPCFFKKDYILYSFVLFYPILPEYFAIDLGASIPLLTVSRILIIILTIYAIVTMKLSTVIRINRAGNVGKIIGFLMLFFLIEVMVAIPHLGASNSVKELFLSLLEKAWVCYLLGCLITTREKLNGCVKCLMIAAVIVCMGGLIETVTGMNPFYLLATAERELTMAQYERLGVTRAEATLGHPISFSVYLLLVIPFIMYFGDTSKKKSVWAILVLAIVTMFATISRASILIFFAMFIWMMVEKKGKAWERYRLFLFAACFGVVFVVLLAPNVLNLAGDIVLSVLNIFGADFQLDSFGRNATGVASRLQQMNLISYVFGNFPLFGGGANYIYTHKISLGAGRIYATSIDNEYLLTFIDKGIVGLVGKLVLYIGIAVIAWKNRKKDALGQAFSYAFVMYFIGLIAVCELTSAKMLWIVISLFVVYLRENAHAKVT